jgi:ElaB/YqjD/DUF883 family membrane-anchored ribosome-binding protein
VTLAHPLLYHKASTNNLTHSGSPIMSASTTANQVRDKAQDLVTRAKDGISEAASSAAHYAGQATDKVREFAGEATDKVREYASITSDKAVELGNEMTDMVKRYPITSVLAVFGIGFILGRILRK